MAVAEREPLVANQVHPILSPMLMGTPTSIRSSAALQWRGILLETYHSSAGERPDGNAVDRPVLLMTRTPAWRFEYKTFDGTFVPSTNLLGALAIKPKGPLPAMRTRQPFDVLCCAFDESLVTAVRDELEGPLPLPLDMRFGVHDRAVSEILNLLVAEVESGGSAGALYVDSLALALTVRSLFLGERRPGRSHGTPTLSRPKLFRIQDLIESRLEADLTLQELAAEIGYSRSHFLRMFRAATGLTPHRYVLQRRIERARRLLREADISIAEVAYSCGFSSQAHLTLAFRKESGLTPAEYRRQR
jgi:AraC family transcriptional regulator